MNKILWICGFLLFATPQLAAAVNWPGELSHTASGALIAGGITATVADKYWPEHRALIGFTGSTAVTLVVEGVQMANGEKFSSSLLDLAVQTFGAMIGATITDRYLLMPVVERDDAGATRIGLVMHQGF